MKTFDREDVSIVGLALVALAFGTGVDFLQRDDDEFRTGYMSDWEPPTRIEVSTTPPPQATPVVSDALLGVIDQGTAQVVTATTLQLRSVATFADDAIVGATCVLPEVGIARTVYDYNSATDTATFYDSIPSSAMKMLPSTAPKYICFAAPPPNYEEARAIRTIDELRYMIREIDSQVKKLQQPVAVVQGVTAKDIAEAVWNDASAGSGLTASSLATVSIGSISGIAVAADNLDDLDATTTTEVRR